MQRLHLFLSIRQALIDLVDLAFDLFDQGLNGLDVDHVDPISGWRVAFRNLQDLQNRLDAPFQAGIGGGLFGPVLVAFSSQGFSRKKLPST